MKAAATVEFLAQTLDGTTERINRGLLIWGSFNEVILVACHHDLCVGWQILIRISYGFTDFLTRILSGDVTHHQTHITLPVCPTGDRCKPLHACGVGELQQSDR